MTTSITTRTKRLLVLAALLGCVSTSVLAAGSPVIDVEQISVEKQVLQAVQGVADKQKAQLNSTNSQTQTLTALLTKIEANQQTLIKQNAATQKILGQMLLQQAQLPMLKGGQ